MKLIVKIIHRVWDKLLIGLATLFVLLPTSPLHMPIPNRDSGVFLYIGWRILNGEIPYRDIWDHKPPIIFYINALGLAIAGGSRWGVWLLELASLFLAAYVGFILVKKIFNTFTAIFSLYLWLISLVFVIQGGNMTTEYTLPLQFMCLWLVYDAKNKDFSSWRGYFIGLLLGITFMIKQNTIGIGLAIIIYLIVDRIRSNQFKYLFRELLTIFSGGSTVILIFIIFFAIQGALLHYWDAAFGYNFVYCSSFTYNNVYYSLGLIYKIKNTVSGMAPLYQTGLPQLAFIGYFASIIWLIFKKDLDREWFQLLAIGLIDLPIELILVNLSGFAFPHYYMNLLPIFSVFAGFTFWLILNQLSHSHTPKIVGTIFVCGILLMFSVILYQPYKNVVMSYKLFQNSTMITYISRLTSPRDTVLMWGAETSMNFFSRRSSPSRFVYQYPLYSTGYTNEKIINEFIQDIVKHKPHFIIDTKNPQCPFFNFPIKSEKIQAGIMNIKSHYRLKENIDLWTGFDSIPQNLTISPCTVYEYVNTKNIP